MRRRLLPVTALILLAALTACTDKKAAMPAAGLPDGKELLVASALATAGLQTAHFTIATTGAAADLPLRAADGVITKSGNAKGTATLDQAGLSGEVSFVAIDGKLHIKGPTGTWQVFPLALAATVYDPTTILNPDKGVANIIKTAKDVKTEAKESVGGAEAYRITATLDGKALAGLVPGVNKDVTGKLWVSADKNLPLKATFPMPKEGGGEATVTITFSDFDAPATISAP